MSARDAERQELERVIEHLGRGTRHARLLEYLGAKYFEEQEDQLTEFHIATQVFGRSTQRFASAQDAVVRVEAHRLRKKLRELYENDARAQGLQISLPAGTYVPKFTAVPGPPPPSAAATSSGFRKWLPYLSVLAIAGVAAIGFVFYDRSPESKSSAHQSTAAKPPAPAPASVASGQPSELHILAGYRGSEVIDNSGVRWTPDRYFVRGGEWSKDSGFIRGTSRPFLFANWRVGEFGYEIPVVPGTYEMRLFFVSPLRAGDDKLTGFNVALNGKPLLEAFDIPLSANGVDVAEEQVVRDVMPAEDGRVHLWFSNHTGSPLLNALELVPGIPGKLNPIRVTMQPTSFVDHKGQRWGADDYYVNGMRSMERRKVSGTEDPELFGVERFGHFNYAIPVDRRGRYTVVLHFVEFYYGPQLPGGAGGVGRRVFHVFCNGQTLLKNFDIYKEAGSLQVVTKRFPHIEPSAQGKINLMFEPVVNNATVSGIEVLDEAE
jgi:hypothetical protein